MKACILYKNTWKGSFPLGRCSEELYWETKKISEELQKSNHEQTALIRAYLREAAQLYVEGSPGRPALQTEDFAVIRS